EIEPLLRSLDANDLADKTVIDPSNNIEFGSAPKLAFTDLSMGESIQRWLPGAHVVKTLTIVPAALMVNPSLSNIPPIQWIAGDDQAAKEQVTDLLHALGWSEVFDLGGIKFSRLQEAIGLMVTGIVMQLAQTMGQ
ncbi:MAG: NADPH-dependent F420 reductase, partial [Ktedonobacterales bacterium]